MQIDNIMPEFKNDNDKLITLGLIIFSVGFFILPALIIILFCKNYVSETVYNLAKSIFNLELVFVLVSLSFLFPFVGWILSWTIGPIILIINILVMLGVLLSILNNKVIKIPSIYKFI